LGDFLIAALFFVTAIKINSIGVLWYQIKYFILLNNQALLEV
jgi:hypothetical protein